LPVGIKVIYTDKFKEKKKFNPYINEEIKRRKMAMYIDFYLDVHSFCFKFQ